MNDILALSFVLVPIWRTVRQNVISGHVRGLMLPSFILRPTVPVRLLLPRTITPKALSNCKNSLFDPYTLDLSSSCTTRSILITLAQKNPW